MNNIFTIYIYIYIYIYVFVCVCVQDKVDNLGADGMQMMMMMNSSMTQ